jgi:hypothetical protein
MKPWISYAFIAVTAMAMFGCKKSDDDGPDGDEGTPTADAGGTRDGATGGDSGSGVDAAGGGDAGKTDPRCLPDGGFVDNTCDTCENSHCCATRFGCYDNTGCSAANDAFDGCLSAATGDGGPADAGAAIAKCWSDLAASGAVANARVTCQRTYCKAECEVP